MKIEFLWDDIKNIENKEKHEVSFEEAATIFENIPLEVYFDPDNSETEDRYIAVGFSNAGRILLVVHCESDDGFEIRIISARKATSEERKKVFGGKL